VNIRIPKAINAAGKRKYDIAAPLPKKMSATETKIPKEAKKIPTPEYILLKLRLRLAKITALFGKVW
jgi:hypothetical protein